ncbi:hypothetical protein JAAARDRAFT_421026 [Jaapia argillacea MUCL 33604]|uniref:Uncharacterized protein n=1 Tax=Jaapia argillacea MUCL 33604 TaxID=933084 RepID=A0A067PFK8_9AGAM|nr:hypothetical protein JAAARDRAFT_421026 [Jaapia argillacea MUCL 33604]
MARSPVIGSSSLSCRSSHYSVASSSLCHLQPHRSSNSSPLFIGCHPLFPYPPGAPSPIQPSV